MAGQYLTFRLGDEEYGVEILAVQEIKGGAAITPIPGTPPHVRGVMNLRGTILPVVDLRARLGGGAGGAGPFPVIVVVRIGERMVGLLVDAVSDVVELAAADIQPAPALGPQAGARIVSGIGQAGERLVVLLDAGEVLEGAGALS